jgi:hypothetical protein
MDGIGITSVLTANTDLQIFVHSPAKFNRHGYQFSNTVHIQALKWIVG